jgi:hypothetical protein
MILDLCADQSLFEDGRHVLEKVRAEVFENEAISQQEDGIDIELMNAVMFFLGSHSITEGEKVLVLVLVFVLGFVLFAFNFISFFFFFFFLFLCFFSSFFILCFL